MRQKKFWFTLSAILAVLGVALMLPGAVGAASKYKTLYSFTRGKDGSFPTAGLVFDAAGNLYGTTAQGGLSTNCPGGCGTVFRLNPNSNGSWTASILYTFTGGTDGGTPYGGLIFDAAGALYSTTAVGGRNLTCQNIGSGCGTVFKLTPDSGGTWTEHVLYNFNGGTDGSAPEAGLVFDAGGNLYGTTIYGGASGYGAVFKFAPNADGSWRESVLHSFCSLKHCADGGGPSPLIFDAAGNLYGTVFHDAGCCGGVFQLKPNSDGSWTESLLYQFTGHNDGATPQAGLVFDGSGNLYGTTAWNGAHGGGVVFKLKPKLDGSWKESVLHGFCSLAQCPDGYIPLADLIFDAAGNLYGTTREGGNPRRICGGGCGVVFKLTPSLNGGWHETVLHRFGDHPGAFPVAGLIFDAAGNLYGTTGGDGVTTYGSVFEITP